MSNVKQVIVMRKKFPDGKGGTFQLRRGKQIAQGAHASMKVLLDMMDISIRVNYETPPPTSYISKIVVRKLTTGESSIDAIERWLSGSFTKICVSVTSEEELDLIYLKAKDAGLPCSLIIDSGFTEFHGEPTKTCCAIGPASSEEIDKITGELPLL